MKLNLAMLKPLRWYYIFALGLLGFMTYANVTGWRVLTFASQQAWGASGPGYHK